LKYAYSENPMLSHERPESTIPGDIRLLRISPNPARTATTLLYDVVGAPDGPSTHVVIHVYDCLGRLVATPKKRTLAPGTHSTQWDLRSNNGRNLSSGVYYLRVQVDGSVADAGKTLLVIR